MPYRILVLMLGVTLGCSSHAAEPIATDETALPTPTNGASSVVAVASARRMPQLVIAPLEGDDPDSDIDEDHVADIDDLCPDSPEDYDGDQDEDGCPDADIDHESIIDVADRCPDEPDDYNDDDDGCPEAVGENESDPNVVPAE